MYGKIIGRALLQCDSYKITILRANLKKRCANLQTAHLVEIQTLLLLDAELSKQTPLLDPEAACLLCAGSRKLQNNRLLGLIHEGL